MSTPRLDARNRTRLTDLGIRVATRELAALPPAWFKGKPPYFLVSDYGTLAGLYRQPGGKLVVEPRLRWQVENLYIKQFGYSLERNLPGGWTVTQFIDVFERLALRYEEQGTPRAHFGNAWAFNCALLDAVVIDTHDFDRVARALQRLLAAGVPMALFHDTLLSIEPGYEELDRAVAASVFRLANPIVHVSLVRELF